MRSNRRHVASSFATSSGELVPSASACGCGACAAPPSCACSQARHLSRRPRPSLSPARPREGRRCPALPVTRRQQPPGALVQSAVCAGPSGAWTRLQARAGQESIRLGSRAPSACAVGRALSGGPCKAHFASAGKTAVACHAESRGACTTDFSRCAAGPRGWCRSPQSDRARSCAGCGACKRVQAGLGAAHSGVAAGRYGRRCRAGGQGTPPESARLSAWHGAGDRAPERMARRRRSRLSAWHAAGERA
jgi:hypothetical protein